MGISKHRMGRFVRAAVVSGLLGAAGLAATAAPVHAQDPSDPSDPSDPAEPSDPSDPGGSTGTDGADAGTTDQSVAPGGLSSLPRTGGDTGLILLMGAGASAGAIGLRAATRRD